MPKRKIIGFYTDEEGRKRPITLSMGKKTVKPKKAKIGKTFNKFKRNLSEVIIEHIDFSMAVPFALSGRVKYKDGREEVFFIKFNYTPDLDKIKSQIFLENLSLIHI